MVTRNADTNQGDGGLTSASPGPADQLRSRAGNTVFKSGPLFISSKGIGWTSWKKRWFILTRTSLVFFRSDPSIIPQKGSEVNLTLGGIDLNNSGSVVVRADKKLLTVLFPDGRDGRAFTLKAETSEDLYEWKIALENALAQAPSAALVMGQTGIFRNDPPDTVDGAFEQWRDRRPVKSLVVGRPILLALEDIDGAPSFLEKALLFIEQYGVKVEGILRHAADVDDVERRVQEYEEGKNEFSPEEDAHIVADCVKHVLRELPSSPVPASCCNALLEAYRTDHGIRVSAIRSAISETFPEPNRRLLQRMLKMMQIVASHKSENRMSSSAVAACMAPLLLRPLLAGDCELENDFNMGSDGSVQLLQAAQAANHAQAIVITLLEEYNYIFGDDHLQEGSISSELYSESEESGSEDEEPTDDDEILEDEGYHDSQRDPDADTEDDPEGALSGTLSESSGNKDGDLYDNKVSESSDSYYGYPDVDEDFKVNQKTSSGTQILLSQQDNIQRNGSLQTRSSVVGDSESCEPQGDVLASTRLVLKSTDHSQYSCITESTNKSNEPVLGVRRPTVWGRTSARKNLSTESIDYAIEDEVAIQRLEVTKTDLQNRIAKAAKENEILHASLERRKQDLHERRLALEQDVARLQEQLQKERDLRETMEVGLKMPLGHFPISPTIDNKTKGECEEIALAEADVINLKLKVADLHVQLNQQRKNNYGSVCESCSQHQQNLSHRTTRKDQQKDVQSTAAASLHERSTRSEDTADDEKVRMQERPSLPKKKLAQKQQLDLTSDYNAKSVGAAVTSSSVEPVTVAPTALSNYKKSGAYSYEQQDTLSRAESEQVRTQEPPSLPNTQLSQKQRLDLTSHNITKSVGTNATSSSVEPVTVAPTASSNSKKSGAYSFHGSKSRLIPFWIGKSGSGSAGTDPSDLGVDSSEIYCLFKGLPIASSETALDGVGSGQSGSGSAPTDLASNPETFIHDSYEQQDTLSWADSEKVRTQESPSLQKQLPQKQQFNSTSYDSTKSVGATGTSSSVEPVAVAPTASSNSKKSGAIVEGTVSTSSALSKLTTRLNFLKERRTQIVNELQNMENVQESEGQSLGAPPMTNSR